MLLQIAGFLSFLWLNNFPLCILCIYTHHSFSFRAIEDVYFPLYSHLKNILTCTTDGMKHCLVIKYHNDNHSQSRTSRLTGSCPAQCPHPDTAHLHKDTHSLLLFLPFVFQAAAAPRTTNNSHSQTLDSQILIPLTLPVPFLCVCVCV